MNPSTIAKMAMVPLPLTREVVLLNNNLYYHKKQVDIPGVMIYIKSINI